MDDALIAALGKLTLGTAGWLAAWLMWSRLTALQDKLIALTERLATLMEGVKDEMSNLNDSVKDRK